MDKLFSYTDYDKISDNIYFLGGSGKFVLRMNVSLARKAEDKTRRFFYQEYSYDSKYSDKAQVVSIRRNYDYYMTLESLEDKDSGVMIRPQDMIYLRTKLADVSQWFTNGTFTMRKDKLTIASPPRPAFVKIDKFAENKFIRFEPTIIYWDDTREEIGVRVSLSDISYTDITVDKYYGLVYIINSINMIQSAQSMLAFIGMPEYGTNRYEIDTGYGRNDNNEVVAPNSVIKERKFKPKGQSYFDKIDNM